MNFRILVSLLCVLRVSAAFAGAADYVYTPEVEYGEKEIDFKFGTAKQQPGGARAQVKSLGVGYGVTEFWFTEVYIKREREGGDRGNIAEWENKFQLTETGKYPVDLGLITEIEVPLRKRQPMEFKFGPLMQTEYDKFQLNGNLLFERKFGHKDADDDGNQTAHHFEMGYQWQVKYRWQKAFEFGAQGIGEMGTWDDWDKSDSQKHRVGPAVFGKIGLGDKQAIRYNAAWLFGTSAAAPNNTFRMQAEYEF